MLGDVYLDKGAGGPSAENAERRRTLDLEDADASELAYGGVTLHTRPDGCYPSARWPLDTFCLIRCYSFDRAYNLCYDY